MHSHAERLGCGEWLWRRHLEEEENMLGSIQRERGNQCDSPLGNSLWPLLAVAPAPTRAALSTSRRGASRCNSNSQLSGDGTQPHAATTNPSFFI